MLKKIELKTVLLGNAVFSTVSGIAMLTFNGLLMEIMGIVLSWILPTIGAGLILFGLIIVYHATRPATSSFQVKLIIFQDVAWVLGSTIIIGFQLFELTTTGYVLMTVVGIAVADFALLRWIGLRREQIRFNAGR